MRPKKVLLIVDTDEDNLSRRKYVMETWGYRVVRAMVDAEVLVYLDAGEPLDGMLILCDESAAAHCRSHEVDANPDLPVLVVGDYAKAHADALREAISTLVARKRGPKRQPKPSIPLEILIEQRRERNRAYREANRERLNARKREMRKVAA